MKATAEEELASTQSIERMQNELLYLRQIIEFLKKLLLLTIQGRKISHGDFRKQI